MSLIIYILLLFFLIPTLNSACSFDDQLFLFIIISNLSKSFSLSSIKRDNKLKPLSLDVLFSDLFSKDLESFFLSSESLSILFKKE